MPITPWQPGDTGVSTGSGITSVNGKAGPSVTIDKNDVSLGNVDNISSANMPVSTAQRTAIDLVTSQTDTKLLNYILSSKIGAASGVASLDVTGKLVASQIPDSILSGESSLNMKSASVAENTAISATDNGKVITTTAQDIILTLAALSTLRDGFTLVVKNTSSGNVTIATTGADTIDGGASFVIPSKEVAFIQADGTVAQVVSLNNMKMARLPIFQDNGTWDAVSLCEDPVVTKSATTITSLSSIAYGSGLYVAAGSSGATVSTSPDLVTWTTRDLSTAGSYQKWVGSNGTSFMCVDNGTAYVHTSSNGVTWTQATNLPGNVYNQPVYINGLWLVASSANDTYYTTSDGVTWTTRNLPTACTRYFYRFGNVVWTPSNTTSDAAAYYTTDGINWTLANLPFIKSTFTSTPHLGEDNALYWEYNLQKVYRCSDGINWVDQGITLPSDYQSGYSCLKVNGVWTVYGPTPQKLKVLTNGVWATRGDPVVYFAFQNSIGSSSQYGGGYWGKLNGKFLFVSGTYVYEMKTGSAGSYGLFVN